MQGLFLEEGRRNIIIQRPLNSVVIPAVTTKELLNLCSRLGYDNAPGLDRILNKAFNLIAKSRPDIFVDGNYPEVLERQRLVFWPKAGESSSHIYDYSGKSWSKLFMTYCSYNQEPCKISRP